MVRKYSWGVSYATHGQARHRASVRAAGCFFTRLVAP